MFLTMEQNITGEHSVLAPLHPRFLELITRAFHYCS